MLYNDSIYLELGVYTGATFYAATENNPIRAMAVDNWCNTDIKPMREEVFFPTIKDPRKISYISLKIQDGHL
ncbi:MAG: hypothetical protein CM15mV5_2370 [uncultured marine virus]|nr:MAG: hypothetical protein CM15mV5_2370 [uncultured marine virus]